VRERSPRRSQDRTHTMWAGERAGPCHGRAAGHTASRLGKPPPWEKPDCGPHHTDTDTPGLTRTIDAASQVMAIPDAPSLAERSPSGPPFNSLDAPYHLPARLFAQLAYLDAIGICRRRWPRRRQIR